MRGVGEPLLCIIDLLADVGEEKTGEPNEHAPPSDTAVVSNLPASELPKLFQENFNELKAALEGTDHSWTAHTLKEDKYNLGACWLKASAGAPEIQKGVEITTLTEIFSIQDERNFMLLLVKKTKTGVT